MSTIAIKNWEKFQHYSDRDPTWIKLYRDVLTTEAWVLGTDISRLLQIAITLLAARYKNAIPNRYDLIKKVASLDFSEQLFKKALEHLSTQNFLEIQCVEQSASDVLAPCYAREEKSRGEERREEKRRSEKDMSGKPDDAVQVFDHWKVTWKHPRSGLDLKRSAAIKRALKHYSVADLCASISGYLNSPHHTGKNDKSTVYDDIELFLRDSSHIDAGIRFFENPPTITSKLEQHNVAVLQAWRPKEMRDADSGLSEISGDDGGAIDDLRQGALAAPH